MRGSLPATTVALLVITQLTTTASAAPGAGFSMWAIAGDGRPCSKTPRCGNRIPATSARLRFPQGVAVAVDQSGNVYLADWGNQEVRKVAPDGMITPFAGNGIACSTPPACGDGGPATQARLSFPDGVAVDRAGNVWIADSADNEIRVVVRGRIFRAAGNGQACATPPFCGDGGPATQAMLNNPGGVAVNPNGGIAIADTQDQMVRAITPRGTMLSLAGDGTRCSTPPSCGDGGPATSARLNGPVGVTVDRTGHLYIADGGDNEVRKVFTDGTITRVAGTGSLCVVPPDCGDGRNARRAQLTFPQGLVLDRAGNLYIGDAGDNEIRMLRPSGAITRVAGDGFACERPPLCGDGGNALGAEFDYPDGVAIDSAGNLYVGDRFDQEVRWLLGPWVSPVHVRDPGGFLAAFSANVSRQAVNVRFVLTGFAIALLSVSSRTIRPTTVASAVAHAGFNRLTWNRRLRRRPVPPGRYTLTVTIVVRGKKASSALAVRL